MDTALEKAEAYINEHQQQAFAFLQEVVQQPSLQGKEKGAQDVVISKLKELGLQVDIWDPGSELLEHPYYVPSRSEYTGSPNVVGVLKGTGGGKSVILNGHIDVVPEGDVTKWRHGPYSGEIENGKMYGRGTTDMKGGNVAMLFAVESILKSGIKLKGDVIFQSVIEEESGGAGTLSSIIRGYKADVALIPEPTNMKLFVKQQGSMWFRVTVEGKSAHAGTRYEGVSAIDKAWKVHQAIMQLEITRNLRVNDPLYSSIPIPLPINVGKIQGGNWPSSVPDKVIIEGRIGVGPEEEMESVRQELRDSIGVVSAADEWLKQHPAKVEFFGAQWVPNAIQEQHPFVQILSKEFPGIYDRQVKIEASPWGTDGGLFGKVGGIPAVVMGPGETKVAHYPDEFIDLQEMIRAARLFMRTIIHWCEISEAKSK